MIKWNEEMINELKTTDNLTQFSKKYGMCTKTARNKRKELFNINTNTKEDIKEVVEEDSFILKMPNIISDINGLIELGTTLYIKNVQSNVGIQDKKISDILHYIELKFDTLNDSDKINMVNDLHTISVNRRIYKDEHNFLDEHRGEAGGFIKFIKELNKFNEKLLTRGYNTRILKNELGKNIKK